MESLTMKSNEVLIFVITWVNFENIKYSILNKPATNNTYYMIPSI